MIIILKPDATKQDTVEILVEVHSHPKSAMSDGQQSLDPDQFIEQMQEHKPFVEAAGKNI